MKRLFVVGCPRSGTTLVQTLLMAGGIWSCPETHFFSRLNGTKGRLLKGFYGEWILYRWGKQNFPNNRYKLTTLPRYSLSSSVDHFVTYLDRLAAADKKDYWVEKTPWHVQSLPLIVNQEILGDAKFIHVIRNPVDTVNSMVKASREWVAAGKAGMTVEVAIRNWLNCYACSIGYAGDDRHLLINYEDIIASPDAVITSLNSFCGITIEASQLSHLNQFTSAVVREDERWKLNNAQHQSISSIPNDNSVFGTGDVATMKKILERLGESSQIRLALDRLDQLA
ncbi:MAG: sulfotransferase [Immundisolibacteraceae bacterium]|nr:sulfotransferase [Immundisolibacteraceae bacterium]